MLVTGDNNEEIENNMSSEQIIPTIEFVNSTIKHFTGTMVQLNMFDSMIAVNTVDIASPMFVLRSSTVKISNCIFHGNNNTSETNLNENTSNTSVIFDVEENSKVMVTECVFENIQVDMKYDRAAAFFTLDSELEIHKTIFHKNKVFHANILAGASIVTITYSVFSHNRGVQAASIFAYSHTRLEVYNSTLIQNDATWCSGITVAANTSAYITDYVFSSNGFSQYHEYGSSILGAENCRIEVHNSTFTHNNATYGPGISVTLSSSVFIRDCLFLNNSGYVGGAMHIQNSNLSVYNSTFTDNNAEMAGAIFVGLESAAEITFSVFRGNAAPIGGAIDVHHNGAITLTNSRLTDNRAKHGGAIVIAQTSFAKITHCAFEENTAVQGGALQIQLFSSVSIANSTFFGNKADKAAGTLIVDIISAANITSSIFKGNSAIEQGGVLFVQRNSSVSIIDSKFTENHAPIGGVMLAFINAMLEVKSSAFVKNNATKHSGVLFCSANANATFAKSSFVENTAAKYGGVIDAEENTHVMISQCSFSENEALLGSAMFLSNSHVSIFNTRFSHHCLNMINIQSSVLHLNCCNFSQNALKQGSLIKTEGLQTILSVKDSFFSDNNMESILSASSTSVSINHCSFIGNIITGGEVILAMNGPLFVLSSVLNNN